MKLVAMNATRRILVSSQNCGESQIPLKSGSG